MRKAYTKVQYNADGLKQCTNCQEYKDTSNFHKYSKAQDKLKPWCKSCVKQYDLAEHDLKRKMPRKLNKDGQIHCRNCGNYFDESDMVSSKNGKHKGLSYCNTCSPLLYRTRLVEKYGITIDQYHQMLEDQGYACKICKREEKTNKARLSIDHNHDCCPGGKSCGSCVRGLLCTNCNMSLGNAQDSIEILQQMIDYLKSYQK